jgi:hypothetical protein
MFVKSANMINIHSNAYIVTVVATVSTKNVNIHVLNAVGKGYVLIKK